MVVWFVAEIVGTGVAMYNVVRGIYNMYDDANTVNQYYQHLKEYQDCQKGKPPDPLTESQVVKMEQDFVVL